MYLYIDDERHDCWAFMARLMLFYTSGDTAMKVSREQMIENRLRILEVASRLFREKGFEAVTVAEVMKAAGLTHGGFYGHFASKDDLVALSIRHALEKQASHAAGVDAQLETYLSPLHRDNPQSGCPTAALAAETRHQSPAARAEITNGFRSQISTMSKAMAGESDVDRRQAAIGSWAAMVGAVILARAIDDPELSDDVLEQTRAWINSRQA